jgi:hypothetical protein
MTTSELFDATNAALCARDWGRARALLDDLGLRDDNSHMLSDAASYGLVGPYTPIIQDRIEQVNSKAMLNSY